MPFAPFGLPASRRGTALSCSGRARSASWSASSRRLRESRSTSWAGRLAPCEYARTLGFAGVWAAEEIPDLPFDAVIDASNAPSLPAKALELVEPAKRVVYVGLAGSPSLVDTRALVLKDVTAVGILSASPGLAGTIELYASGSVDPRPLVAATVSLDGVGAVLAGERPPGAGLGPKIHVDPRI